MNLSVKNIGFYVDESMLFFLLKNCVTVKSTRLFCTNEYFKENLYKDNVIIIMNRR